MNFKQPLKCSFENTQMNIYWPTCLLLITITIDYSDNFVKKIINKEMPTRKQTNTI